MRVDRVLANNPGPFTGPGTNTWVLDDGAGSVVVIDPGPVDSRHERSIQEMVGRRSLVAVLVTHTHPDHAPLANPYARNMGVPAVGYAPGPQFEPDIRLLDGAVFDVGSLDLRVLFTPGHSADHLCFRAENVLFSGDHIIGGSSVMVDDMGRYLESLRKVHHTGLERIHPGHGEEMSDPDTVIGWYLAHRLQRHEQIYSAITDGHLSPEAIVEHVYADVDKTLYPLAERSVRAHLELMSEEGRIAFEGDRVALLPSP